MTMPAWWEQNKNIVQNKRSKKQETSIAKITGGHRVAGSGSSWRQPQDVKTPDYLIQAKYTDKNSFAINILEWLKIRKDAHNQGREPAMVIEFPQHGIALYIIEMEE